MALQKVKDSMRTTTALDGAKVTTGTIPEARITSLDSTKLTGTIAVGRLGNVPATDTSQLEMNQALLSFKIAASNQLAKFSMVDQMIDEYQDTTGIDAGNSTDEYVGGSGTAKYFMGGAAGSLTTTVKSYTGANQTFVVPPGVTTLNFIAWGAAGGGGSTSYGGGGGFIEGDIAVNAGETLNVKVGGGGGVFGSGGSRPAGGGGGTGIYRSSTVLAIAGAGGGGENNFHGVPGGGLQGADGNLAAGSIRANGGTQSAGGAAIGGSGAGSLNQGGHVRASSSTTTPVGYNGGGTGDGDNVTFTGGGGGGGYYGGGASGDGAHHGSGAGGSSLTAGTNTQGSAGTVANAGHANYQSGTGNGVTNGIGQHGHAVLKYTPVNAGDDLILQSEAATNAPATAPTTGDLVVLIDDGGSGTSAVQTNIKGFISRNGTFATLNTDHKQVTFVDEGTWGTTKQKILVARNVDISGITTGTSMKYRLSTHSQSAGTMETRIHATSLAWA